MQLEAPITLRELVGSIIAKDDLAISYCIYGHDDSRKISLDTTCYMSSYPDISSDDKETYPLFVSTNNLEFWYSDELVQDVVENALHQNPAVSDNMILDAIEHYSRRDCFLTIIPSSGPHRRLGRDVQISNTLKDAQRVDMIKLVRAKAGMSLSQSKETVDLILNGEPVDFRFEDPDTAAQFTLEASTIGFLGKQLREHTFAAITSR